MFNMENVGRRISELRKEHNMTQMELADKLGISFQAVSNWERGNSMPDISKLPELAELFDVSIDELLGEKSEVVDVFVNGDIKDSLEKKETSLKDVAEIAPILKPNQIDEAVENVEEVDLEDIIDLFPFLDQEAVDVLITKAVESGNFDGLEYAAPFAGREVLSQAVEKMLEENKEDAIDVIEELLPFIGREAVDKLIVKMAEKGDFDGLEYAAPFAGREAISFVACKMMEAGEDIEDMIPFIDRHIVSEYIKKRFHIKK